VKFFKFFFFAIFSFSYLCSLPFYSCVLQKCLIVPCGDFVKRRRVIKEGDLSPWHTDNSDDVTDELQASDKFHCNSATTDTAYNVSYLTFKTLDFTHSFTHNRA
jgi:hypothetical protein